MTTVPADTDNHHGVTTLILDHWFADPDAWEYLSHHATRQRSRATPGTSTHRLLTRAISLGADMARALADAAIDAAIEAQETATPATNARPPARTYLAVVHELIAQGEHPELVCTRINRRANTIARALRRAGDPRTARLFDRLDDKVRRRRAVAEQQGRTA